MPAIHVNAPGMIVNVNMAHQGEPEPPSQTDDDTATIRLRLGLLPTEALAEIGKQVCLVCYSSYSSEKAAGLLPCQHYFCASCIKGALEPKAQEPQLRGLDAFAENLRLILLLLVAGPL